MRAETRKQNAMLFAGYVHNKQLQFFAVLYKSEDCKGTTNTNFVVTYKL